MEDLNKLAETIQQGVVELKRRAEKAERENTAFEGLIGWIMDHKRCCLKPCVDCKHWNTEVCELIKALTELKNRPPIDAPFQRRLKYLMTGK